MSWISEVWERLNSWVAERSLAVVKSRSSRLMNTFSVCGAEGELDVRINIEWSLTWPVNLFGVSSELDAAGREKRDVHQ